MQFKGMAIQEKLATALSGCVRVDLIRLIRADRCLGLSVSTMRVKA